MKKCIYPTKSDAKLFASYLPFILIILTVELLFTMAKTGVERGILHRKLRHSSANRNVEKISYRLA